MQVNIVTKTDGSSDIEPAIAGRFGRPEFSSS